MAQSKSVGRGSTRGGSSDPRDEAGQAALQGQPLCWDWHLSRAESGSGAFMHVSRERFQLADFPLSSPFSAPLSCDGSQSLASFSPHRCAASLSINIMLSFRPTFCAKSHLMSTTPRHAAYTRIFFRIRRQTLPASLSLSISAAAAAHDSCSASRPRISTFQVSAASSHSFSPTSVL